MPRSRQSEIGDGVEWSLWSLVCVVTLIVASSGSAFDGGAPEGADERLELRAAAESGYERLGTEEYLSNTLKFGLSLPVPALLCSEDATNGGCKTRFRSGIQAPIRLRLGDHGPGESGRLRGEDWDEPSDVLRTIRFVEYGRRSESVFGRIGDLGAISVGHGTIVNNYFNVVSPDHYAAGFHAEVETSRAGGSALVDDLVDPELVGGRAYLRPGMFVGDGSWASRLTLGMSLVGDVSAPVALERSGGNRIAVGADRYPAVRERRGTAIGGLDLSLAVVDTESFRISPYGDVNYHFGTGRGFHTGILTESSLVEGVEVSGKLEFRALGAGYLADYFGPLYEVDRYQYFGWGDLLPRPKLRVAAGARDEPALGGYGEVSATVREIGRASVAYGDHEGPGNASSRLSVHLSPIRRIRLGLFYFKQNFDHLDELFQRDGTFLIAESRTQIVGPLYAKGAYGLTWRLRDDGIYQPMHRWSGGVGASFKF